MLALVVVVADPCCDLLFGMYEAEEQGLIEQLITHPAIEALPQELGDLDHLVTGGIENCGFVGERRRRWPLRCMNSLVFGPFGRNLVAPMP